MVVKVVVFRQSVCIRAKVFFFWPKWLYSVKIGCIWAKVVVFGQSGFNRVKIVVFGKNSLESGKLLYSRKSGCNRAKMDVFKQKQKFDQFFGKEVVVFVKSGYSKVGQSCIRVKVVVF